MRCPLMDVVFVFALANHVCNVCVCVCVVWCVCFVCVLSFLIEEGIHLRHDFIEYHKVRAFTLEPSDLTKGAIGVDGEHAPLDALACWVLPNHLHIIGGDLGMP
jgi:diacylglycerol kinase family enzyme